MTNPGIGVAGEPGKERRTIKQAIPPDRTGTGSDLS